MNILLTNDDGLETRWLKALYQELKRLGKVTVISPLSQQSGVSHGITIFTPLFVQRVYDYLPDGVCLYAVRGTPADCVKLALGRILKKKPDIVVSGINDGANVGLDTFYSGTVAAALEGAFWGIPAFAVSREKIDNKNIPDFSSVARLAVRVVRSILSTKPPAGSVFNINIPGRSVKQIKGVKYTRQGTECFPDEFVSGVDPRGRDYFWMKAGSKKMQAKRRRKSKGELPSDIEILKAGYVSITPLKTNLTDYELLQSLNSIPASLTRLHP